MKKRIKIFQASLWEKWNKEKDMGEEREGRRGKRDIFRAFNDFYRISVQDTPISMLLLFFNNRNKEISDTLHILQRAIRF